MNGSSIFEKIIIGGASLLIALGVLFGSVATSQMNSVVDAKDRILAIRSSDSATIDRLKLFHETKSANAMRFLISGQAHPYLDEMGSAREDFLDSLVELRKRLPADESKNFLEKIQQAEMDEQISLTKAIDSRRSGPNYIAITVTVANLVQPKQHAVEKLIAEFRDFKSAQVVKQVKAAQADAQTRVDRAKSLIRFVALVALAAAAAIWVLITQMLVVRRRREVAALKNEAQLRSALEATQVVTWERDLAADLFDKSQRHLRLYGFSKDPPRWNFETYLRAIVPEDRDRVKARIQAAINEGGEYAMEYRVKWYDKSVHWVLSKACVYRDEHGTAVKVAGFDTNIDALKLAPATATDEEFETAPPTTSLNH